MTINKGRILTMFFPILLITGNWFIPFQKQENMSTNNPRKVAKIVKSSVSHMGEILMKQPLPSRDLEMIDPFLLLHHHGPAFFKPNNSGLPFGPHPHRGFETVTLIIKGDVKHRDSNGFESVIESGGVQWMTAGKGLVHSERSSEKFKEQGGELELIQLWVNLPASKKMVEPHYEGLQKKDIPQIVKNGGDIIIDLISGSFDEEIVAGKGQYPIDLYSITLHKNATQAFYIPQQNNILFYILEGKVLVNDKVAEKHELVLFENQGTDLKIKAESTARILLGHALPINEKVVSHGPFVMNSEQELYDAINDYKSGKMGSLEE